MIPAIHVSVARQAHRLRQLFPEGTTLVRRSHLAWTGKLRPTPFSDEYAISLTYNLNDTPVVVVPDRVPHWRGRNRPPHLHSDGSLCLYYPPAREWRRDMLLGDTILPWSAEWLLHYELWLATGKWMGGGIHPRQ
jgi:hypothetical protein